MERADAALNGVSVEGWWRASWAEQGVSTWWPVVKRMLVLELAVNSCAVAERRVLGQRLASGAVAALTTEVNAPLGAAMLVALS